ncbi:DoxX family protein [Nocardia acidivorans]|uniref:DoxX family protein n=1 Tax=Nocardia acidivorans TaxID=404580 RepID=UPI0012FC07AE|nr:DoxX family protein [Nocardia acidivorans]
MAQLTAEVVESGMREPVATPWHPLARTGFRLGFVFLEVGMAGGWLTTALVRSFGVPQETVAGLEKWTSLSPLTDRVAAHLFGLTLDYTRTGSGDTAAHWVSLLTWLLVALAATAVWSVLDRRRPNYVRLYAWFRLLLRAALVSALLLYGMVKVLPSQMTFVLQRLVEPFGDMSPMSVLWTQTSLAPPYEIALGAAEITAGLLLILPVTAGLGALLAFLATLQVALLNLTFDVPVKIFALQLLAFATVLAAPDIRRTIATLLGRAVPPRRPDPHPGTRCGNRIPPAAQLIFGGWLLFTAITEGYDAWHTYGNARPQSPLYGIWNVTEYAVADRELPALIDPLDPPGTAPLNASNRLRRIIFDIPDALTVQRMNDSLLPLPARIDTANHTITISTESTGAAPIATFDYERPQSNRLILTGRLMGRPVRMRLDLIPLDHYPAVSRGFHWVQATPYMR